MKRLAPILCLAACHSPAARTPVRAHGSALPASIESCALLGDAANGRTCSIYDTQRRAFVDGSADPLARRVFLYERFMDLYSSAERQSVVRNMRDALQPGDPESRVRDTPFHWDDQGDSAGFGDTLMISVLFHYAVTGTAADYDRFESWLRGAVRQWDATGMDGYLARFHFAGVAPGTPIVNGRAMDFRSEGDGAFDIPTPALEQMPAYYRDPGVRPSWYGHTSIDAYAGPMNSWPLAFSLVKDPALRARMARHYGCFLKRLRIFKIVNLSKNAQLQADVARYLTSGVLHLDPGDPDLTKTDQVWGFYLPQYNDQSAASYPRDCPAHLATEAAPEDVVDVTRTGYDGKLLLLLTRQFGQDAVDSMDFAFYPSVRAGDALQLQSYALGAYAMTGDEEFLRWRDQVLIAGANAREVSRTIGAFIPPRPCRSYYRTPNVYTSHFTRTLLDGDTDSRAFAQMIFRDKFALKEMAGLRDTLFEVLHSAASGTRTAGLDGALADLEVFGGAPGHLDDPRRNYAVDLSVSPPPPRRHRTPACFT
jgi:hypothetical protein